MQMAYRPIIKPAEQPAYEAPDSPRILTVLVNRDTCDARGVFAGMSLLAPGQRSPSDIHEDMQEVFYVVSGQGTAMIDHAPYHIEAGDVMYVQNGVRHQFIAADDSDLHLFWVFNAHPDAEFKEKFNKWKPVAWPVGRGRNAGQSEP
jgi:mannose-6-phosphate isomerase-like protein (cupin superfamily)